MKKETPIVDQILEIIDTDINITKDTMAELDFIIDTCETQPNTNITKDVQQVYLQLTEITNNIQYVCDILTQYPLTE